MNRGLFVVEGELAEADRELRAEILKNYHLGNFESSERRAAGTTTSRDLAGPPHVQQAKDQGLRAVERHRHELSAEAGDRLDRLIRSGDPAGITARYVAAVSSRHYESAFATLLMHPSDAQHRFSAEEVAAIREVSAAMQERAMSLGGAGGADGGFAVPFVLDPTLLLSGDGALNPIRQAARVVTIAGPEWRGVSADGVSAAFQAELSEVAASQPTLAQPTIRAEKAQAYVEFSIELDEDWANLRAELGRLLQDAKDTLESSKFLDGTGTNEPEGILTGATNQVPTSSGSSLGTADAYTLLQDIPPRFAARTTVVANPVIFDTWYQLTGGGSDEPPLMPDRGGAFLGRAKVEWSEMDATVATGDSIAIAGDIQAGFTIIDRIGFTIELIPHVLGAQRRPIGARALYAFWRVGSGVTVPNAIRVLVGAT